PEHNRPIIPYSPLFRSRKEPVSLLHEGRSDYTLSDSFLLFRSTFALKCRLLNWKPAYLQSLLRCFVATVCRLQAQKKSRCPPKSDRKSTRLNSSHVNIL